MYDDKSDESSSMPALANSQKQDDDDGSRLRETDDRCIVTSVDTTQDALDRSLPCV